MKRGQNRGMARKYLSLKQTQERLTVTKTLTQRELDFIHKIETVRVENGIVRRRPTTSGASGNSAVALIR